MSEHIFSRYGGTRFLLTLGCGAITTLLLLFHYIDQGTYQAIILGTVGAYIAGNTIQNAFTSRTSARQKYQENSSEY